VPFRPPEGICDPVIHGREEGVSRCRFDRERCSSQASDLSVRCGDAIWREEGDGELFVVLADRDRVAAGWEWDGVVGIELGAFIVLAFCLDGNALGSGAGPRDVEITVADNGRPPGFDSLSADR
jgi:hypothetical protein